MKKNICKISLLSIGISLISIFICSCGKASIKDDLHEENTNLISENQNIVEETKNEENRSDQMSTDYAKLFENLKITKSYKGLKDTNPCMTQRFGADPYAMVYNDRVYFYMTADAFEYDSENNIIDNTYSKIHSIEVISTDDMVNFTDHGTINAATASGGAKWASNSWAPAATWKMIDGKPKFFLYFADSARGIGVLSADDPAGPFTDPLGHALITKKMPNCDTIEWLFDPAVLVDDDGSAYLYFGGGVPKGKIERPGTARVAKLGDDMISIVGDIVTIDPPYLFEDSGIHKAFNKYYYTYCTNWNVDQKGTDEFGFKNGEIACMESDSPMGPFTYKERILKNPGEYIGLFGNNHHCVFKFKDEWYMTYHARTVEKAMGIEKGYRSTHIDKFTMQEDGSIGVINQTIAGREQLQYVNPYVDNKAVNFAVMGGVNVTGADDISKKYGCGNMALGQIDSGDFIEVRGVDFGTATPATIEASVRGIKDTEGVIAIRVDGLFGETIGYLPLSVLGNKEFETVSEKLLDDCNISGVHDLFFIFNGEGYQINTWKFTK